MVGVILRPKMQGVTQLIWLSAECIGVVMSMCLYIFGVCMHVICVIACVCALILRS